jgi:hypothetical protein
MRGFALAVVAAATLAGTPSPDGKWSVDFSRKNGYGRLDLTERSMGTVFRMYRSNDGCCSDLTWVAPHLLVFVDDYRTFVLDPTTRRHTRIAGFSNIAVSRDGKWVAGWADSGGHSAERVAVVPIRGGRCRAVPKRANEDDTYPRFSRDSRSITVLRRTYDAKTDSWAHEREVTVPLSRLRPIATC